MATVVSVPSDPNLLQYFLKCLIRDRPTNMGAASEKLYGLIKDENGNLRIPLGFAKLLWNFPTPQLNTLPRKPLANNIVLGQDGRDYQIPTYQSLVMTILQHQMVYLSLYCGAGKSIIAAKLICEMGLKTAIVTDAVLIFPQWVKIFHESTNARVATIDKPVEKLPEADVYIFMVEAVRKTHPSVLSTLQFLVVDEALYFMTETRIAALLNFSPIYTLGLCAEIKRDDGMHCFIPYFFGNQMIRRVSEKPFTVYRIETPYIPKVTYQRGTGQMDWNTVLDSIAENDDFNEDIIYLCRSLPDSRIIIGTKRVEQAQLLHDRLKELGEKVGLLIRNARMIPQCRILVGIYAKMGKGVDVKNLCPDWEGEVFDAAILAASMKKPEQFVGRVFRHRNPVVYDFVHNHSTLRNHFDKFRQPWYKKRKGVIHSTVIKRPPKAADLTTK